METSKKKQTGCGLGAKFGPSYAQCCEKSKETGNIIRFFHISLGDYLLKQKAVVVKSSEWEFMAIIAINAKGCQGQILARFGSKMAKKLIIFNNFTLVSQP